MTWKVFGGKHSDLYLALLKARCAGDGLPDTEEALSQVLTVHLHRGIGYLAGRDDLATISGLVGLAMAQQPAPTG
ncbi:DNA sulfur modification protein DndE [Nocardia brasiliensis ATCC 700358]|uniref:DNA sulfur modification protein DndE n=2 Tax=Nocardia brasiliensis TaxID=37326 RepID=K0EMY2_NOCB7|nr:DNA sulfur modification protein DndE [Nocardia brasiliensis ATCC 700358]